MGGQNEGPGGTDSREMSPGLQLPTVLLHTHTIVGEQRVSMRGGGRERRVSMRFGTPLVRLLVLLEQGPTLQIALTLLS